jgi:hypothetical protein
MPESIELPTREAMIEHVRGMVDSLSDEDLADLRRSMMRAALGKNRDFYRDPCID